MKPLIDWVDYDRFSCGSIAGGPTMFTIVPGASAFDGVFLESKPRLKIIPPEGFSTVEEAKAKAELWFVDKLDERGFVTSSVDALDRLRARVRYLEDGTAPTSSGDDSGR